MVSSQTSQPTEPVSPHCVIRLAPEEWMALESRHQDRMDVLIGPLVERRMRREKDPVNDFIFDYYALRPNRLRRWHPGIHTVLEGDEALGFLERKGYRQTPSGVEVDPASGSPHRRESIRWIHTLLTTCAARPPQYGCFGLHEWAMVYRNPDRRHPQLSLRLSEDEVARVVEEGTMCCSHFDAFRFFSPEARPLNRIQLSSDLRFQHEQRGCLHVNMDLFKWACKLLPWTPSDLVTDCLELAFAIRAIDMRASAYDLAASGYEPICIETPQGRDAYEVYQKQFAARAIPLRQRLIDVCTALLEQDGTGS